MCPPTDIHIIYAFVFIVLSYVGCSWGRKEDEFYLHFYFCEFCKQENYRKTDVCETKQTKNIETLRFPGVTNNNKKSGKYSWKI